MPTIIRRNERSWAISMISDINIKLQSLNIRIARAGGETTISTGHQSMFPDVLLYGDENQTQILQGWELKLPDTSITDITFINDAQRKAVSLGLNSCFIWNFNAGVFYAYSGSSGRLFRKYPDRRSGNIRTLNRKYPDTLSSDFILSESIILFNTFHKYLDSCSDFLAVG